MASVSGRVRASARIRFMVRLCLGIELVLRLGLG